MELEELKSMDVIEETKEKDGAYPKYKYRLKIAADDTRNELKKYEGLIHSLNRENARFLELVATIIYFQQEGYPRDEICDKVKIVKSDKNYTDDEIKDAFDFLRKMQDEI